ncbi:unnamed protein product [marine sediment metagenome]|uniref:Uncharacterized protein n=1 Tax=marine sediment metagenome TaxID=412755 RepID=X1F623_9ZZZZ
MPKEETIELRKVRNTMGELTDLPEDNPRASLSSRIRALLLRVTGIPQLAHLYGTLELDKTITLAAGENNCQAIFSDGSYLYAGLNTAPAKVVKIDLSNFTVVSTLTLAVGENNCQAIFSDGSYLYAGLNTAPAKVVKIDLSNFTAVSTLTLAVGENNCQAIFSDGSYLYAGLNTAPAKVVKIDLSNFTVVSTLTLAVGEDTCYALFSDGSYLYAGLNTAPAKVVKIDLSNFTVVSTLTLAVGEDTCYALFSDGSYLYAGLNTAPAKVVKIDLSNFTAVSTLTLAVGEDTCYALFSDGSYLYAGLNTAPAKIIRRYIMPTNATLRDRKIDRINERLVEQSIPLSMYGVVTTYTDITHFKCSNLSRFGNDFFKNWYVYVVRDSAGAGAAPQGEDAKKISDYTSSDGTFEHTAFTVDLAVDDEVLILHEAIGSIIINTEIIDNIFDLVNAILTLTGTGGTITTTGALQSLYINNAPAGVFQPRKLLIDFSNHVAGDVMIIRTYYRLNAAGALIKQDEEPIVDVQDPAIITIDLEDNRFGYEVTIHKTVGANLTYDWEVIYKI